MESYGLLLTIAPSVCHHTVHLCCLTWDFNVVTLLPSDAVHNLLLLLSSSSVGRY